MSDEERICLLNSMRNHYTREMTRGALAEIRHHVGWVGIGCDVECLNEAQIADWQFSGCIGCFSESKYIAPWKSLGLPVVNISNSLMGEHAHSLLLDNKAVGRMAALFFLERGYSFFAHSCPLPELQPQRFHNARYTGYAEVIQEAGYCVEDSSSIWEPGDQKPYGKIEEWLKQLPKPSALFCYSDSIAKTFMRFCRDGGIHVPDEIAILGCDNDDMLCDTSYPSLSSIQLPYQTLGREAFAMLHALHKGEAKVPEIKSLPPVRVVERESTNFIATQDPVVAQAIQLMQDGYDSVLRIEQLAKECGVSKRGLEMRFKKSLRHSPLQELQAIRIRRAKVLLTETNYPCGKISFLCGFENIGWFSRLFKRMTGVAPTQYRETFSS